MIGILTWIAAGLAAALLARLMKRRKKRAAAEFAAALSGALLAGFAATAVDFGGIAAVDARSALFAFACAAAAIATLRLAR